MKIHGAEMLRQGVFAAMLLTIAGGSWLLVFRPRAEQDKRARALIEAKQAQLRKLNIATATIGNLREEIGELEKAVDFFQSKLPNEKEIDKVLEEVWRLAEANHLTTRGIFTTMRSDQSPFIPNGATQREQPIKMEFHGDYAGLYGFLLELENQPRIMRVRNMTLTDLGSNAGGVKAEVDMSIFFETQKDRKPI